MKKAYRCNTGGRTDDYLGWMQSNACLKDIRTVFKTVQLKN